MRRQKEVMSTYLHVYTSTLNRLTKGEIVIDQSHIDLLALIEKTTQLQRVAGTEGGEYAGQCPLPGCPSQSDALRVQPNNSKAALWWCRQCGRGGDAIVFTMAYHDVNFPDALAMLGIDQWNNAAQPTERPLVAPDLVEPPNTAWQKGAISFLMECQHAIWSPIGKRALDALHLRGFTNMTICAAHLGFNVRDRHILRTDLGFAPEWDEWGQEKEIWLPAGIVIPWFINGQLWKMSIRRPFGEPRYYHLPGSANALYNADMLRAGKPAILCEGPFDALAIQQATGGLVSVVASGTTGARRMHWMAQLIQAEPLLLSFDADDAGLSATVYWQNIFSSARVWRPYYEDPAAMLESGADVRDWAFAGVGWGREGFSIDHVRIDEREAWRVWDDATNAVIGEYHSEAEAEALVT
jgi:DNA primase